MLKIEDIKTVSDMQRFVEGCINDLDAGVATKEETVNHLKDYTMKVITLIVENVRKNNKADYVKIFKGE